VLTPGSPTAHPTPALVAHAQGGLTLGPERGELAADFWSLGVDSTNKRLLRTAVLKTFETLGQVTVSVFFEEETSRSQEVVFDVLEDSRWSPCFPEVTIGSKFLYNNQLLDPADRRSCHFTIRGLLVLLVWQEQEPGTMQQFPEVLLQYSGCENVIKALLDTGSASDAMSHAYATAHFPERDWRRQGSPSIRCSGGSETPSSGRINITIQVGDLRIRLTFIIVKDLAQNIILGHDFWVTYSPFMTFKEHVHTDAPDLDDPIDHWLQDVNTLNRGLLHMGKWMSSKWRPPAEPPGMCFAFKITDLSLIPCILESTLLRERLETMDREEIKNQIFWDRRAVVVEKYRKALREEGKPRDLPVSEQTTAFLSSQDQSRLLAEPGAHGTQIENTEQGDQKPKIEPETQKAPAPGAEPDDRKPVAAHERGQGPQPDEAPEESSAEPAKGDCHQTEPGTTPCPGAFHGYTRLDRSFFVFFTL
jgi:hypothetical protein